MYVFICKLCIQQHENTAKEPRNNVTSRDMKADVMKRTLRDILYEKLDTYVNLLWWTALASRNYGASLPEV